MLFGTVPAADGRVHHRGARRRVEALGQTYFGYFQAAWASATIDPQKHRLGHSAHGWCSVDGAGRRGVPHPIGPQTAAAPRSWWSASWARSSCEHHHLSEPGATACRRPRGRGDSIAMLGMVGSPRSRRSWAPSSPTRSASARRSCGRVVCLATRWCCGGAAVPARRRTSRRPSSSSSCPHRRRGRLGGANAPAPGSWVGTDFPAWNSVGVVQTAKD